MLGTISTLATVNILVACVGGFVEVFDVCREARGKGPAGWPFFVTNPGSSLKIILHFYEYLNPKPLLKP